MKKLTIQYIILILLYLFGISLIIWKIIGHSPTTEQILLGILIPIIFALSIKTATIHSDLNNLNKSFRALAKDFKIMANDFKEFQFHFKTK